MYYKTRTYIAGGWDESKEAIQKLYEWNNSDHWSLDFSDAHELTQSRDTSLPCTIKDSLSVRLRASKTFVLIVSEETADLRKGSCQYCRNYRHGYYGCYCESRQSLDYRSFIEYECEMAAKAYWKGDMKIVVLYDGYYVKKNKCPEPLSYLGAHIPMKTIGAFGTCWNYHAIRDAIMK